METAVDNDMPETKKQANGLEEELIPGQYKLLALEVRSILGWDTDAKLTYREAARLSGISHTAIMSMAMGDRPTMELVIKFGKGMDADVNALLAAAEYHQIFGFVPAVIRRLADPKRFRLESGFQPYIEPTDDARYIYTMTAWNEHGPGKLFLLPATDEKYHARTAREYLRALEEGDAEAKEIDNLFLKQFLSCVRYAERLTFLMSQEPKAGCWDVSTANDILDEVIYQGRSNALALAAWYERRNDYSHRLPTLDDLLGFLTMPDLEFTVWVEELKKRHAESDVAALEDYRWLMDEMRLLWEVPGIWSGGWPDRNQGNYAEYWLQKSLKNHDPNSHAVGLMYLGLYIAVSKEGEKFGRMSRAPLFGAAQYAHALTRSLMDWWKTTDYNPQLSLSFD